MSLPLFVGGLSFTGRVSDLSKLLLQLPTDYHYDWIASIPDSVEIEFERISSHYSHSRTVNTVFDYPHWSRYCDSLIDRLRELAKDIDDWRIAQCSKYYLELESEYEYLCSEESLIEFAEANEYQFDEYGRIV